MGEWPEPGSWKVTGSLTLSLGDYFSNTPAHPRVPIPIPTTGSIPAWDQARGALGLEMLSTMSGFPWVLGILIPVLMLAWPGLYPLNHLPIAGLCTPTSRQLPSLCLCV